MEETWRVLPSDPRYLVSDQGRVVGVRGRLLKPYVNHGYPNVMIKGRWRTIHSLVLEAFTGPPEPGQECLHRNGDRTDNRLVNLHYGTRSENVLDAVGHGTWTNNGQAAKTHCARGHEYTEENTHIRPNGWRTCQTCAIDQQRERRAAKRALRH